MKTYLKYGLSGLLLLSLFACKKEEPLPSPKPSQQEEPKPSPKPKKKLKGLWGGRGTRNSWLIDQDRQNKENADRYLGKGYNLLIFDHQNDPSTKIFLFRHSIVNFEQEPWSPFGDEVTQLKPEVKMVVSLKSPVKCRIQTLSDMLGKKDSIVFHLGDRQFPYEFHHEEFDKAKGQTNRVRRSLHKVEKAMFLSNFTPEVIRCYLDPEFIDDLKWFDANEVVHHFGTHIVGRYTLGATLNFTLDTDLYIFTEEETKIMESWLWESNKSPKYNTDIIERMYPEFLSISYRQKGSAYNDRSFSYIPMGELGTMVKKRRQFSEEKWEKAIIHDMNHFISLDEKHNGLIAIPDLISDIPLKIKYVAGILHWVAQNNTPEQTPPIHYVLSDPKTYKPIKLNKEVVSLSLNNYADVKTPLYLGESKNKNELKKELLELEGEQKDNLPDRLIWEAWITGDGLWTFRARDYNNAYLCRDFKLRTKEEDKDNFRFWLLNPIMPNKIGNSTFDLKKLFIQ